MEYRKSEQRYIFYSEFKQSGEESNIKIAAYFIIVIQIIRIFAQINAVNA